MKLYVRYPAVLWTSAVAGVFSLIVGLLLTIDFVGRGEYELFDTPEYLALKVELKENPSDERIQQSIRDLDRRLRIRYFQRRQFLATGVYLLLGGVIVTLVTARWAATLRPKVPHPLAADEAEDPTQKEQQWGRRGAVALVTALMILLCAFALQADRILPRSLAELTAPSQHESDAANPGSAGLTGSHVPHEGKKSAGDLPGDADQEVQKPATVELPSRETYMAQWPRFRGPTGSGVSPVSDIPDKWDGAGGEGVLWKVAVPLPGHNSPVVWKDRVFVSGATPDQQAIFCFDANSGALLWQLDAPPDLAGAEEFEVAEYTGYAAPTMATDGLRAYAIFASANIVAVDFQGNLQWRKSLGIPKNPYGHASSLATYKDLLIIQLDQGSEEDDLSKLLALRGATGEVAWEVPRPVSSSWASPVVVQHGGRAMVITSVAPWLIAYSADDGAELWRAECVGGEVGPSPVFSEGVVFVANEASGMFAVAADGSGDVTQSHVEWFTDIDVPDVCSPLVTDKYVLLLAHGLLACFDRAKRADSDGAEESREPLWEEDLLEEVSSSPSQVGECIYLFSEEGKAWIMKPAADKCERIAEFEMGEPCRSSPAFQPGRFYIRGDEHLFCIGK